MTILQGIFIALGSNLGDRAGNILRALALMKARGIKIRKVSDFIETKPYGVTDQPDFLNAVVRVETGLSPEQLVKTLLDIETTMGRVRKRHWGERNIDLDLLLYNDKVFSNEVVTVPHPDMLNRDFVLAPLAEIAAKVVHPVAHKTIEALWKELQAKQAEDAQENK